MQRRRDFLRSSALAAGGLALGPAFWRDALAQTPATPGPGPYGPLQAPDVNGLMLPAGFSSRVVAQGQAPIPASGYVWHLFSDGAATYPTPDGGWILVSNSEVPSPGGGGASAIRFGPAGTIEDAYRILGGTETNCAGGLTPWGTWLSCEETDRGRVWECDPAGKHGAVERPHMGVFKHEAACIDPVGQRAYLTEDVGTSGFYRFTPAPYPNLSAGTLEIATGAVPGQVTWAPVPDPLFNGGTRTYEQVPNATHYRRGEGIWFDSGFVYVATTSDDRVYAYNTSTETIEVLYDGEALGDAGPLHDVDNITVHPASGDLFAGEDNDNLEVCVLTVQREIAAFVRVTGAQHQGATALPFLADTPADSASSEVTGPAFNPDGTRLYFSSQRAFGVGVIYEVSGPFRRTRTPPPMAVVDPAIGVRPLQPGERGPAGAGGGTGGTPVGPGVRALRLRAPARRTLSATRRSGLGVVLFADRAGTYEISLVARFTPAQARRAGRRRARRTIVLARARRSVGARGRVAVSLRLRPAARRALRGRRKTLRARLVVRQLKGAGAARRMSAPVRLTVPPRRRRRRRRRTSA